MNKESVYFINACRLELLESNNSLTESDKSYLVKDISDGDVLSLVLTGKHIPNDVEDRQSYVEGIVHAFSEMFFEGELQLEIDANNNSFNVLKERDTYFTPAKRDTYFTPKMTPNKQKLADVIDNAKMDPLSRFTHLFTGRNIAIGVGVAAAVALAYKTYKTYKAKHNDKNKAKNAQIQQLNKAKSMANKTENPNAFRKSIDDKINKIKQG